MSDNLLQRYTHPVTKSGQQSLLPVVETGLEEEECGCFGYLRGARDRALMLELRKRDGNIKAVGYGWLSQAEFDPSVGITLHVSGQKIHILGRNLNAEIRPNVRLFQGILRQRIPWIQELDEPHLMLAADGETVIDRIEW